MFTEPSFVLQAFSSVDSADLFFMVFVVAGVRRGRRWRVGCLSQGGERG